MIKYTITNTKKYSGEITDLYIQCFSAGLSAQHIDPLELKSYMQLISDSGYAVLAIEAEQITGALLCLPLTEDKLLPENLKESLNVNKCLYIAELMIDEKARGRGLGKELIRRCTENADRSRYSEIVIRVWEKNEAALHLYLKEGFKPVGAITQLKRKPDGTELIEMKKIYLSKRSI
jgi:ribosomal protein S18 acetylase RimI-like enzyme